MKCIYCENGDTKVVDTRESDARVRRRRECKECGERFTTYEEVESLNIKVEKSDETVETFNEDKIRSGLEKAVEKTPVDEKQIEEIIEVVKSEVKNRKKVSSKEIGRIIKEELKSRNEVAYIRFASVYDSFEDLESLQKEVEALKE
ncbi:transcriptional regulator NrdR [Candidatus Haloredivivus sp. G17]|jgi:transcriptional repressor NrdR|nr:transcriptional regulator NrdR [Candidatus Haloredivivus sp. G17]